MDNSFYSASKDTDSLKALVLSIIQGDQDYGRLVDYLEPVTQDSLDSDTALTLALLRDDVVRQAELNDRLHALLNDEGAPALVMTEAGVVLAQNPAAITLLGEAKGVSLTRLGVSRREFSEFQQRIVQHQGPSLLRVFPSVDQSFPVMFVGFYQPEQQWFVLRSIDCHWPESIDKALHDIFGLTDAERDILAFLAQGMSSEQISQRRQRSIGTVRQQIKSLLAKLGASSQVQAAALAAALANQSMVKTPSSAPAGLPTAPITQGELIRGARRLGWRRFGKIGGQPVLLLHGAYFGAGDYEPERTLAIAQGLDVVAIERPGYGRSQLPTKGSDLLQTQLDDFLALLDYLKWPSASLLSQDFGFVPAIALAARFPNRVSRVLAISPPALYKRTDSLVHIPRYQRMFIWAGQHAPWMLKLLLRLAQMKARDHDPENWMDMTFEGASHELAVFQQETGRQLAAAAFALNQQQNGQGQELDLLLTLARDWSAELAEVQVPVYGLLGGRNQTFPPAEVRRLATLNPRLQLQEIAAAGLTLSLTHIGQCYDALADMLAQA